METLTKDLSLTAHDRCDRCGAQAYVKYELNSGGSLLFCVHHATANDATLVNIATKVIDESDRLFEN